MRVATSEMSEMCCRLSTKIEMILQFAVSIGCKAAWLGPPFDALFR